MRFRESLVLAPIAALASGCAMRPWTPARSVDTYGEDTPAPRIMAVPGQTELIAKWQLPPSNPWARYEKMTLMAALDAQPRQAPLPDVTQLEVVRRASWAGARVAAAGVPNDTMWVVDLRGAASVAFGAALSRGAREPVSLVPTFNNWPADDELVPAEEALSALIAYAPRLPDPTATGTRPILLLDSWRLAYRFDEPGDDVTDNRYLLYPTDLPDLAAMRANGITRVVYLVEDIEETNQEEDDLHPMFAAYQSVGIAIDMVDLAFLERPLERGRWDEVLAPRALTIEPRLLIIDDPHFYGRARGGFGGIHGGPWPLLGGPHAHGGGFGGG